MKYRHKSLMGLIYCCLLAIPFVSILSRVIYTQANANAEKSYSGTQVSYDKQLKYTTNDVEEYGLISGNTYKI